jgi:hypothetical protein
VVAIGVHRPRPWLPLRRVLKLPPAPMAMFTHSTVAILRHADKVRLWALLTSRNPLLVLWRRVLVPHKCIEGRGPPTQSASRPPRVQAEVFLGGVWDGGKRGRQAVQTQAKRMDGSLRHRRPLHFGSNLRVRTVFQGKATERLTKPA